jgi:hypothetical protein
MNRPGVRRQPPVLAAVMALPDAAEHESTRQLLGQRSDGAAVSQPENRMDTVDRLHDCQRGAAGHQPLVDASV